MNFPIPFRCVHVSQCISQINFEEDFTLDGIDVPTIVGTVIATTTTLSPMNVSGTAATIQSTTVSMLNASLAAAATTTPLPINFTATTWEPIITMRTSVNQLHETASVYLFCCALSLAAISAFLRAGFVLKFLVMMACIGVQGAVLHWSRLYQTYDALAGEK